DRFDRSPAPAPRRGRPPGRQGNNPQSTEGHRDRHGRPRWAYPDGADRRAVSPGKPVTSCQNLSQRKDGAASLPHRSRVPGAVTTGLAKRWLQILGHTGEHNRRRSPYESPVETTSDGAIEAA